MSDDFSWKNTKPLQAPGLLDLFSMGYEAWAIEKATDAELRILSCQRQLIHARRGVAEAELDARHSVEMKMLQARYGAASAALLTEEAEANLHFHRAVRQAPQQQRREIIGAEIETEKLLAERAQVQRQRLSGGTQAALPTPPDQPVRLLEAHITDEQIEKLAVQAATKLPREDSAQAQREWADWRAELSRRLPPYAAEEVARRADELRGLMR